MNALKDLLQRCHQRHGKLLRQRKTVVTPALYKGLPYHFTVYCGWRYPVNLYELERAGISFMPIGRAPEHDHGPRDFGGERFLRQQGMKDWEPELWEKSWGIQVYTGTPSEHNGAQWHDIDFKYAAICAAPDTVLTCIQALVNAVANPLLVLTKSGGLRFSCRVKGYLHPNTDAASQYIYKHTPTTENPDPRDVYLEIFGDKGYSRWDGRYEILLGNLLDPPIIVKEVLFAPIDTLRTALHQPAPSEHERLESIPAAATVVPVSLGSHNLNLAREAFLKRGFAYIGQEDSVYHWIQPGSNVDIGQVLLWEQDGVVWVRASVSDTGLPIEATQITDIWDDTGILPSLPSTGLPVSDKVLAVREGTLSPLGIKRPSPVLQKPESSEKVYGTLEENATEIQRVFNRNARILSLNAETGAGKNYAAESYVLNGGTISLTAKSSLATEAERRFQERNLPSFARWKPRTYLWDQVKEIPVETRMATPFQHGNVCEDPERCDTLERKGGNPDESICPKCAVYIECQARGYLSQPAALKSAKAQIVNTNQLFLDPARSEIVKKMLEQVDDTERLCIVDEAEAFGMFIPCSIRKGRLKRWRVNWHGNALANFADSLLNALEIEGGTDDNAVSRVRAVVLAFEDQAETLVQQMGRVNVAGRVVPREFIDDETGKILARFRIEFEGGASAFIPLDADAVDRFTAKRLPVFQLENYAVNEDVKISMSITQAVELGILNTATVENIKAFPKVYPDPNWTLWHQLKRFFAYYTRDADAPMLLTDHRIKFWVPPVLHPSVKRLLFMSSMLSEQDLYRVFPDEEIEVHRIKPTAWTPRNRVFQIRTGTYPAQVLLNYDTHWDILGLSETGQNFFLGIQAEIEKNPNVKHAIITNAAIMKHLRHIAGKKNVCLVAAFVDAIKFNRKLEMADVIWIVSMPYRAPGFTWRYSQILFGNDEKPLCYEGEAEYGNYKDERIQSVYNRSISNVLVGIIGHTGLNRLSNKTVVLLTGMPLPNITDRPETLLFDWADFEIAGGLDKLPEVIAERQRFETERDNLTAESGREKVEQVLGISSSQANRVLMKLRGGTRLQVPLREQILSCLADGEKKSPELIEAIEGKPGSIRNALKRLIDTGEIVKVRRSVYALPSKK